MNKSKKIISSILAVIGLLIICAIVWFNTYHYFSPLYEPCKKKLYLGMDYSSVKMIMNPYLSDKSITFQELNNRLDYSGKYGVFCMIEMKDGKAVKISIGREF